MRVLITSILLATGCVAPNGDESFVIRHNLAPPDDGTCGFVADANSPVLSRGFINVNSTLAYQLHPLFESRIQAPDGRESLRTIQITGAEVTLEIGPIEIIERDPMTREVINVTIDDFFDNSLAFTSLFTTSLAPNQGLSTATIDIVPLSAFSIIKARTGDAEFNAQVVAVINPFGEYYGEEIDGTEFRYPVTVCSNCGLVNIGVCEAMPELGVTNGCNPFQDGTIECCEDTVNGGFLCAR